MGRTFDFCTHTTEEVSGLLASRSSQRAISKAVFAILLLASSVTTFRAIALLSIILLEFSPDVEVFRVFSHNYEIYSPELAVNEGIVFRRPDIRE